jgi:hypothetical protein
MLDTTAHIILMLFSLVPYFLVSWGYVELTHGGMKEFWVALGVLLAVRLFFSIIEALGVLVSWHVYSKKVVVSRYLTWLRSHHFPKRKYFEESFVDYLERIEEEPEHSQALRATAKETRVLLTYNESFGIFVGMRMHAAANKAFDIYSPKSESPPYPSSAR